MQANRTKKINTATTTTTSINKNFLKTQQEHQ